MSNYKSVENIVMKPVKVYNHAVHSKKFLLAEGKKPRIYRKNFTSIPASQIKTMLGKHYTKDTDVAICCKIIERDMIALYKNEICEMIKETTDDNSDHKLDTLYVKKVLGLFPDGDSADNYNFNSASFTKTLTRRLLVEICQKLKEFDNIDRVRMFNSTYTEHLVEKFSHILPEFVQSILLDNIKRSKDVFKK